MKLVARTLAAIAMTASPTLADVIAVVSICSKEQKVCKEETARSVYRIPVQGQICFVPIQQRLAEMGVYDEKLDDINIRCEATSAG